MDDLLALGLLILILILILIMIFGGFNQTTTTIQRVTVPVGLGSQNASYQSNFNTSNLAALSEGQVISIRGYNPNYRGTIQLDYNYPAGLRLYVRTYSTFSPVVYQTTIQLDGDGSLVTSTDQ